MATYEELTNALRNADASGNTEDAKVLAAEVQRRQKQYGVTAPVNPTEGMSTYEKTMAGVGGALEDKWHGAKQFANWASGGRIGDKAQLEQEAADKAKLDKPLTDTTAGSVGNFVGSVAPELLLGGGGGLVRSVGAKAAAKLIPQLAGKAPAVLEKAIPLLPKFTGSSLVGSGLAGAADAQLNPSSDYSPGSNAAWGAAAGLGGDVAGRVLGRIITPITKVPDIVKEQVGRLREGGFGDSLRAVNTTGNPLIESVSHAFEKTGLSGISGARDEYSKLLTKKLTTEAGTPLEAVGGGGVGRDIMANPTAEMNRIKALPDNIPLRNMSAELTEALQNTAVGNALSGSKGATKKLLDARGVATTFREMSPEDFMASRAHLSEKAFNATGADKTSILAARDALENAFKEKYPNVDLAGWKGRYGLSKDIEAATPKGGGQLDPTTMMNVIPHAESVTPGSTVHQLITDVGARSRPAPGGENRALLTRGILGGLGGLGTGIGLGALTSDDPLAGAVKGGLGSLGLARFALGTKKGGQWMGNTVLTPEKRAMLRRLLTGGAIGLHDYASNKD